MPWNLDDVDKHKKGLTDTQKKKWIAIANAVFKKCQADKGGDCDGMAIRIANSRVTQAAVEGEDAFTIASRLDEETLQAVLDAKKRGALADGDFAISRLRKLPIHTAEHTRNAMARFNQVKGATAEELRIAKKKIIAAAKKFGIELKEFIQVAMPDGERDFDTVLQVEIYQAHQEDLAARKIPILIGRSGISKMPVGMVASDGGIESTYVMWSRDMIKSLKEHMAQGEGLKSYYGHVLPNQYAHRDNSDWIATLDKTSLRTVDMMAGGQEEMGLVGDLQVHADNDKSNMLMNRIVEAPDEVKFSLNYQGTFKPIVHEDGKLCMEVCELYRVKSVDWVPEAGYDNGIWQELAIVQSMQPLHSYLREVIGMNIDKYKELHPEEYKVAEAQIIQSAVAKTTREYEAEKAKWESDKITLQAAIEEAKKKGTPPSDGAPAFRDSSEYKTLVLQNETLAKQNSLLIKKNSATDLTMCRVVAEGLVTEALQQSLIPEALWPRVKNSSAINYNQFLVDDAEALTMTIDKAKFTQALQTEIESWENSMPKDVFSIGGVPLKGEDGQIVSAQQAETDAWIKEQRDPNRKTYGKKKAI